MSIDLTLTPSPSPMPRRLSENISHILSRGEKLDLMIEKTEQLEDQALVFRKVSERTKASFTGLTKTSVAERFVRIVTLLPPQSLSFLLLASLSS